MGKKALIYGISGQDGHYLSELLQKKGYAIAGVNRKQGEVTGGATKIYCADLAGNPGNYLSCIDEFLPDEIYNLAGIQSHGEVDAHPELAFMVNALAPVGILRKISQMQNQPRFFQASSAYIFGGNTGKASEKTPFQPVSIYGISKLAAHLATRHFRDTGLYACNGILFNHESPFRTTDFVTRKITCAVAEFKLKARTAPLVLGNLDARRDWGFAGDYVEAMWLMLQQKEPDDYVIATGESHSVREFCEEAFAHAGLDWKKYVKSDRTYFRPSEVDFLCGDCTKAKQKLGWKLKMGFKELVRSMVDADMAYVKDNFSSRWKGIRLSRR